MSDPDEKPDDKSAGREWTDLDDLYGEWIARDVQDHVDEASEHYRRVHNRGAIDAVTDFLFASSSAEECNNPQCDVERFEEGGLAESESWWQRWFRSSNSSNDGESGSSD
jgi:hypothetical protein